MNKEIRIRIVVCSFALLSVLAGCTPSPAPTPTPDPNVPKTVRSNDPRVMNNPNIPDDLKRQIGRSKPAKP